MILKTSKNLMWDDLWFTKRKRRRRRRKEDKEEKDKKERNEKR